MSKKPDAEADKAAPAPAALATPALRIRALQPGRRRAGMAHPTGPVDHPAGTFAADQIEALRGDPVLVVEDAPAVPPS
jgi:hypothetical protein